MGLLTILQALVTGGLLFVWIGVVLTTESRITASTLEIRVLGKTVRRVPLATIEEVHRRGALFHEPWAGLKFWNAVTIRRRGGLLRNLVVTPDDPERFMAALHEAIRRVSAAGRGQ